VMMYRVPRPSRSNGVKLHTIGDHEIGIEYTVGEPHLGKMAYDSSCGIMSRNITFVARDAAMPKAGKSPIGSNKVKADTMEYDDDASKVIGQLMDYLEDKLTPEQLEGVTMILSSGEGPPSDTVGEPPQGTDRRARAWGADDRAIRPMSERNEAAYLQLFPNAGRLG
jgi:hypothetical protein